MSKEPEHLRSGSLLLSLTLAGLLVYLALFFASPCDWSGEHRLTRGGQLLSTLLLADELLIGPWLDSPSDLLLLDRFLPLTVSLMILAVAGMLGHLALAPLQVGASLSSIETLFFSEAVGLNLVSTWTLAVGLFGGLHQPMWFIVPALVVAAGWVWLVRVRNRRSPAALPVPPLVVRASAEDGGWLGRRWLWVGGLFALVILLGGLLPPAEFDVREYHLEVPKEFYAAGRIGFLPHNVYGNMALGAEMHTLLGMVLAGDWWTGALAGKAILALFAPLTALGLLAAGRRLFSPAAGVLAAVIYISIPLVANISTIGFVEGAASFYLFATLYAILLVQGDHQAATWHWLLPGYLAGASVACKYPGLLFVVAPLGAWLLWRSLARRDESGRWKPAWLAPVVFGLAVFLGCGLWLAKNWVLADNPLYPMLFGLFGGETLTPEKAQMWKEVHKATPFTLSALLVDTRRVLLGSDWLSPILIPLAAMAFFHRRRRPLMLGLAAYYVLILAAWWCLALRIDRYWAPILPVVALLAGVGATWCRARLGPYLLVGLLAFNSLVCFLTAATAPCIYPPLCVPYNTLRTSPDRVNPWHLYLNRAAEGTVLLVGEAQVFDFEVPILYNTWLDDSVFESIVRDPTSGTLRPADRIGAELRSRNILLVYVSWSEIGRYVATGYGRWDFVRPELFQQLVADGVLEHVPPPEGLEESINQVYRVSDR